MVLNVWQVNINGTRRSAIKCSSHLSSVPELSVFYIIVFSVDANDLAISSRMRTVVRQTRPFQCLSAVFHGMASMLGVSGRWVQSSVQNKGCHFGNPHKHQVISFYWKSKWWWVKSGRKHFSLTIQTPVLDFICFKIAFVH